MPFETLERLHRARQEAMAGPNFNSGRIEQIQASQPGAEMRAYDPTWRDVIANWLMGDAQALSPRGQFVRGALGTTGLSGNEPDVSALDAGMLAAGPGAASLAARGIAAAPKAAAAAGGLLGATLSGTETADAKLTRKQQRELEMKQAALNAEADAKRRQGMDEAQIRLQEQAAKAKLEDERAARMAADQRAEDKRVRELPFRERNPEMAQAMAYGGMAAGAAVPYAYRLAKAARLNSFYSKWADTAKRAEEAALAGNKDGAKLLAAELAGMAKQAPKAEAASQKGLRTSQAVGGLLPFEGGGLPEQIDLFSGSPQAKERAMHEMNPITDPHRYIGAALQGLTFSGLGAKLPVYERNSPSGLSEGVMKTVRANRALKPKKKNDASD